MLASRWRVPIIFAPLFCFVSLGFLPAVAHGPLHEQISELISRIQADPQNAALYVRRGELHSHDGAWAAALADYDHAAQLDPGLAAVDLARGKTLLAARRFTEAKQALDRFLAHHPDHAEAYVTRARILVELGKHGTAVEDYTRAVRLEAQLSQPNPDHYLERAHACAAQGEEFIAEALRGLDEAIEALGPIVTLELYAIELELTGKRYDAALARLEMIRAQSRRQERWLARRGEILEQAGRAAEARLAYEQALAAIGLLPERHRKTRATTELEAQIHAALTRLAANECKEAHP